jgi:colanic acid biosynthesis glycosyl transferase WcaI
VKALIIGLNYAPEKVGIGPYTTGVAEALATAGHDVQVVTAPPYYPAWSVGSADRGGWRRETRNGVRLVRCPLYVPRRPNGLKRVLHHLSFALSVLGPVLVAAAWRRPRLVIAVAPSLASVPMAWAAAKLARAPLWLHVQDFEVEAAFATGLIARRGWMQRLALSIENRLLRSADLVSSISPQMTRKLVDKGVDPDRVRELRNWAEDKWTSTPAGVARYREEWSLGDRQVALYSGNIAAKQGIGLLIEAARLLAGRSDIALVICGEGPNRAALEEAATGLANVHLHPLQPQERMGDLLALASVHLLPQLPDAADLVLPSKLANMLGSGRPVVATAAPRTGLYDEVAGCGIAVIPGDAQALADAIAVLVDDPLRREALGSTAKARARKRWSRRALLARFVDTAQSLAHYGRLRIPDADDSGADDEADKATV